MITLLFSRRNHPGSWLIRTVSWSEWSHVEIILPDGRLLGAAAPHGVGLSTYEERMSIAAHAATMCVPGDMNTAAAWGETQLGKPYDYVGVVGLGLHRDWEKDDKWWCSEFAAEFLVQGGFAPYRADAIQRLTPQHLWMLNYPFEIVK